MNATKFLSVAAIAVTMSGCIVSKKKYDALLAQKMRLEADNALCEDSLNANKAKLGDALKNIGNLTTQGDGLRKDTSRLGSGWRSTKDLLDQEKKIAAKLRKDYNDLLVICDAESSKLNKHLSAKEKELLELQANINRLSEDLQKREQRIQELQKVLDDKERASRELRDKVANALLGFKDKGLTVYEKDGKVYVSLSEQLLFKTGSIKVDEKGEDALKQLSAVLKDQKDLHVMVEGHTDDVPFKGTSNGISDNWDLSVLRATSITKILTHAGMDPKRVTAAGHGEYSPMAEGKTAEARAKNRRTDIILTPNLDELYKILNSK